MAEPSTQQFVQMTDEEALYQLEVEKLEKRGKRLRRAALTAGIFLVISIVCTIYTTIAVRWVLIEWLQPEKTAYQISGSMPMFKFGIVGDLIVVVSDTLVGVLIGLILIGAGVNPATSSIIIVFKVIQQAIMGMNTIFLIAAGFLLDENLPAYTVIQKYFYSDNMPPIGTQLSYLFLMMNQYGHYMAQSKLSYQMQPLNHVLLTVSNAISPSFFRNQHQSWPVYSLACSDLPSFCGVFSLVGWDTSCLLLVHAIS